ncbi:A-kinase anchor protein 17B-like [Ovis canadensis]|uniref:A-kinase anchor protein 17B-like n=1 Tax=Ovis canadensis TaxID=37174 RepID=UPI0038B5A287
MTVTVVYDNSEATELCAAQHLYLKPIAKLMINVLLPESPEPSRPVSNWEVLDQLKSLICPDQFTTVRLAKSTRGFIRFEGEAETRSLVQILKAKLHGKIIKLNGLETDLKVMVTDAQGEWEHFPKENGAIPMGDGSEEQDHDKSPNSIYFEGLPCKWFAPKGSSGEKPCEEILRVVFESFGKIKNVDIPMLDPYREVITSGSFGGFNFGLQTFEAFIQYQESTDFLKAMESLRGMKLMLKGDDGKALACNIKVMFDTTKHFSEGAIKKRNQERLKLQELEEERKKAKKREEEEAERKRKEERKVQEKRRKARVKRRTQKERDRHRQRRQKDSAKVEAQPGSNSSEDLEKRKIPLTQRHLEALYLMRALLRKIVESEEFYPRKVNIAGSKAHHALGTMSRTLKKEEPNTQYLQNQEEMLRYHVSKSDYKRKRKMKKRARAHLRKSSHHLGGRKIRYSARKERAGKSLTDEYNKSLSCEQNSLQIIMTQGQSLEKEDQHGSNTSYSSRFVERDHSRKQKIYETDEFIDYLLNHYQTPKYARICLEPSHITSTCQWKRTILVKGNSFQINLRKHKHHSTSLSQMQHLDRREQVQENDLWTDLSWDPEHISQKKRKVDYAEECTKKFKHHFRDTASEAGDCLSPTDKKSHLLEKTHAYQVQDPISTSQSQVSSSKRSADFDLKLRDFLEEISSDSECLSDNLSVNKEKKKKSVATYDSCPEKGCLDADEIITCDPEIMSSQQALYAEWKHDGEEKYSEYKLRKPSRRSAYELRCSWLEGKNNSIRNENSNSKEREILAPQYLFDESHHHKSSASDQLDTVIGKRRQLSDSAFDHRVNYRLFQVPVTSSKSANASYLWGFPKRREIPWRSEYNWDAGKMKRREYSGDFMLNSDSYYIRHNSLERIDYRSYLRNNFTSSFYFQMF